MSKNTKTPLLSEDDFLRMHGAGHVPADFSEALDDKNGGDLLKLVIKKIVKSDPEDMQMLSDGLLAMLSKSRMSDVIDVKFVTRQRETMFTAIMQSYKAAIAQMGRADLEQLADILITTGDLRPLMAQIETGQSLTPPRLQNILSERAARAPADLKVIGTDFSAPVKTKAPDFAERTVADFNRAVTQLIDYKSGEFIAPHIEALRNGSSRRQLEILAEANVQQNNGHRALSRTALRAKVQPLVTRMMAMTGAVLNELGAEKRAILYTNLGMLSVLPFLTDMARAQDLAWPKAVREELLQYDRRAMPLAPLPPAPPFTQHIQFGDDSLSKKAEGLLETLVQALIDSKGTDKMHLSALCDNFVRVSDVDSMTGLSPDAAPLAAHHKKAYEAVFKRFDTGQRESLFDALHNGGAIAAITNTIKAGQSLWPLDLQHQLENWMRTNSKMLRVVEVDTLLPPGTEAQTGIKSGRLRQGASTPGNTGTEPRLDWLLDGLKTAGFSIGAMTLYREKAIQSDAKKRPYIVLDVKGKDGEGKDHAFQVAVCLTKGNATYVIRKPVDFEKDSITIAQLKADDTVFQFSCFSEGQWLRNVKHYALSDAGTLATQLKTRLGWHDKKDALIASFRAFCEETGQLPPTLDQSIVDQGPLAGQATWARAYQALQKGAINGLYHVRTFEALVKEMFGPDERLVRPRQAKSARPGSPIDAVALFSAAVSFMSENPNQLPANDIGGQNAKDIDRAFRHGHVANIERVLDVKNGGKPSTIQDFWVAVGLAEKGENGVVSAVNPRLVQTIKRFVIN